MFDERVRTRERSLLALDALSITVSFIAAYLLRMFHDSLPLLSRIPSIPLTGEAAARSDYALLLIVNLTAWVVYLRRSRLYRGGDLDAAERVLGTYAKGLVLCMLATGAAVFALKMYAISRLFVAYFYVTALVLLSGKHALVIAALRRLRRDVRHRRHALVIGAARPALWFADVIRRARRTGYHLAGLVLSDEAGDAAQGPPVLGRVEQLDAVLKRHRIEEVFIVGSAQEMAALAPVAQRLIERGRVVSLVSTLSTGRNGVLGRVTQFDGVPLISYGPMPRDEVRAGMKRTIDVVVAGGALLLAWPLMLAIALAIRLSDPGPALFKHERLGLGGRRFRLFKFRSMRTDAERLLRADAELYARYLANDYKLPEDQDPRISALGRWLRRTSLDELPQLWNVLRGDMTLVGPRPIVPQELAQYEPYADLYLSVRPGLTGHWQVSGRSRIRYPERAFLDLDYVGNHSVATDLSIIARTVPAVLKRKGAY